MRRTLIKSASIISMDDAIGDLSTGDVLVEGSRIVDVRPSIDLGSGAGRDRDRRRYGAHRHPRPDQRAYAHLADGAARLCRELDAAGIFPPHACRARDRVPARRHLHCDPRRRAEPDQLRHHHAGRLVPQQSDARPYRRRRARADRERHPRRLLPRLAKTRAETGRAALLGDPASAPRGRAAAGRSPRRSRRPRHARACDPRSALFDARRRHARFPPGARAQADRIDASGRRSGQDARRLGEADRGRPRRHRHQYRPWQRPARRSPRQDGRSRRLLLGDARERDDPGPWLPDHRPAAQARRAADHRDRPGIRAGRRSLLRRPRRAVDAAGARQCGVASK